MALGSTVDETEFDYSLKMMFDRFFYILFPNNPHLANSAPITDCSQDQLLH